MEKFILCPDITVYPGIRVTPETNLEYVEEGIHQTVRDMVLHTVTETEGTDYKATHEATVQLHEGDVILWAGEKRGYVKPVERFVLPSEAIAELECIKEDTNVCS